MTKAACLLLTIATVLCSCGKAGDSVPVVAPTEAEQTDAAVGMDSTRPSVATDSTLIHTKYVYIDSDGRLLTVENSYPKGGMTYTDREGGSHVYAVFWTRITNDTTSPFELALDFGDRVYALPSSPGRSFKLYFPDDAMIPAKEALYNYGLDVESYLDNLYQRRSSTRRTIYPTSTDTFYVVVLFNRWVDGTMRTGLRIEDGRFVYDVNGLDVVGGVVKGELLRHF